MKTLALLIMLLTMSVIAEDTYSPSDHWGPIRILSQKDIEALPEEARISHISKEFGKPFDTTVTVLVYPKKWESMKYTKENAEQVWNCGYWIFFKDTVPREADPEIAYISSVKSTKIGSESTIDWPKSLKGKKLRELLKTEQSDAPKPATRAG